MKKNLLERLMATHPELEIWWDSSPLVYSVWAEGLLQKTPADRAGELRDQLKRLYDPEHPEETLFRGVTTNPPLSLAVIKTRESLCGPVGGRFDRKETPVSTRRPSSGKPTRRSSDAGAEMYLGVFQRSKLSVRLSFRSGRSEGGDGPG